MKTTSKHKVKFLLRPIQFIVCLLFICGFSSDTYSQKIDDGATAQRGIQQFKDGRTKDAIESLRTAVKANKNDADAWYYLGLALNKEGDKKNARKAFEKAVNLRPDFAPAHTALAYMLLVNGKLSEAEKEANKGGELNARDFEVPYILGVINLHQGAPEKALQKAEAALKLNPDYSVANLLKAQALFGIYIKNEDARFESRLRNRPAPDDPIIKAQRAEQQARLKEASDSLEKYIRLSSSTATATFWREQLKTLQAYSQVGDNSTDIYSASDVTTKAVVLSKPVPGFTEEARRHDVNGTIRIKLVLGADGKIKYILALQHLGYGLDEQAVAAARKIKFVPATKDGRNVSQIIIVEYSFNIY